MNPCQKTDKRLRILLVGPFPPPMGGIVRYAQDMMDSELAKKHEITFFRDNIPFEWRPRSATDKFTWNIIRRDGFFTTARVLSFVAERMISLNKELKRGNYDVLHVLSTAGLGFFRNSVHIWLAKKKRVKTVFHLLGQIDDLYRDAGPNMKKLIKKCLDLSDVHIVQSPLLAEIVRAVTCRPVYSVFNGVKVNDFTPEEGYSKSSGSRIRVIALGVPGHKKGTFDLLEAASRLKKKDINIEFLFVGAGDIDRFNKLAEKMDVADSVCFTGSVDDKKRIELLKTSDVFALPSHAEGQPIALLEALAAGLPVVSSTVGSIPEVVKEKNGFLVKPGDVDNLVKHLEVLATNKFVREEMGRFNAREALEKYRVERVMSEIDNIYASLK